VQADKVCGTDNTLDRIPADNERFGATAAGRADLKSSAKNAAAAPSRYPVPLHASRAIARVQILSAHFYFL